MKPKLRFNEFNDEWNKVKISSIVQELKIKTGNTEKYPLWSLTIENGVTPKTDRYERSFLVKKDDNYKIVEPNNYVYNPMNAHLGAIARNKSNTTISVSGYYDIFKINNKNYSFYDNYFVSPVMFKQYKLISTGSLLEKQRVHYSQFKELEINLPTNKEQVKISNFLSLLDKKIELQSKKIEDLKLFKKGLTNNIFSNLNVIKEEKLGNICNITTGKLNANAMVENGQYRFYTCAKDFYYIDKYAFDTEALLISGNGAYVGYIHYYKGKFNAYQRTYVLNQFKSNIQYIKIYLDSFLSKRINSEKKEGNTPYIVLSTLSDMTIKLTDSKSEEIIINCINSINSKIKKEELKLNKLNELKKGLMQNMFV